MKGVDVIVWLWYLLISAIGVFGFTVLMCLALLGIGLFALRQGRILMIKYELAWSEPREALENKVLRQRKQGSIIARLYKWQELKEEKRRRDTLKLEKKLLKDEKISEPSLLILPNREK